MKEKLEVRKSILLKRQPADVWRALTDPELTKTYMFGCRAVTDWQPGSPLEWVGVSSEGKEMVFVTGTVLRCEKEKLLQFTTFDPNGNLEDVPSNHTTVTYRLLPEEDGTAIEITQGDFRETANGEKQYEETVKGWDFALAGLRDLLEG